MQDSIERMVKKSFDPVSFKRSTIHRLVASYGGKMRVKKSTTPLVWCLVNTTLEEIIAVATEGKEKARVKKETIYNAIHTHPDGLLDPLKSMIGDGTSFSV